jgi:hypothetical protein
MEVKSEPANYPGKLYAKKTDRSPAATKKRSVKQEFKELK